MPSWTMSGPIVFLEAANDRKYKNIACDDFIFVYIAAKRITHFIPNMMELPTR